MPQYQVDITLYVDAEDESAARDMVSNAMQHAIFSVMQSPAPEVVSIDRVIER